MAHRHPEPDLLQRLLRGEATPAEMRDLACHLLETCPDCAESLGAEAHGYSAMAAGHSHGDEVAHGVLAGDGTGVIERARASVQPAVALMARAQAEAPGLLAELERHPVERQRLLIRNTPRFQNLALADLLLEEAWERRLRKPMEGESMIALALEVVDRVDGAMFTEGLLNDLRGRAWAYRGNALRIRSALREAEEAFCRSRDYLAQGTGDPLETARLLGLWATLYRFQWRLREAGEMIEESLEIYQALGERHLVGRTMVTQAILLDVQGDPAAALELLREAQELVDLERDPYLVRVMQQNLMAYLSAVGRYEEAMALIPALRCRVVDGGNCIELLRLRWQEGKLLLALGHESRAEAAFLEVRKGFVERGIAHDGATVSLELASLYLRQGRTTEIRELARQMVPIFQSRDLHQGAIAALLLFQRAVEMDTLTLRMVEEVADAVRRAQGKPRPKNEEPS